MKQKLKRIFEKLIWWSGVITIGIVFGLGIHLVLAWTEPSVAPPGGNVEAPVNISDKSQYKIGALGIGDLLAAYDGFWLNNNGQDVSNKVLTADAQGFASWQTGGGGGGCYVSYKNDATDAACVTGFKNKGSAGHWGYTRDFGVGIYGLAIVPPGGTSVFGLSVDQGQAYVCCQN